MNAMEIQKTLKDVLCDPDGNVCIHGSEDDRKIIQIVLKELEGLYCVTEIKPVWIAWTNDDLTEGRGCEYPLCICEQESTAIRLGKGKYVQGSDCRVTKSISVKYSGKTLSEFKLIRPSKEDVTRQLKIEANRLAIKKAKSLGLTDDDISDLKND